MPIFHDLRVSGLEHLTDDAIKLTLEVPEPLRAEYRFTPGQHLTFAHESETGVVRRTFSICSTPASGELSIAIKVLPGGVFSGFVAEKVRVGDRLRVMTPAGRFSSRARADRTPRTVVAVVAGSGITPVMSIMTTLLETEPETSFVLCYGSRRAASVMFAEDIADLKDRFLDRLEVFHMISGDAHAARLLSGRIDAERLTVLLRLHPPTEVDEWFVCGPLGLIETASDTLTAHGVPADAIHREVFFTGRPRSVATRGPGVETDGTITFRLDGRTSTIPFPRQGSVLDAVLGVRPETPFACRNGVCGTCRMRVLRGDVAMAQNYALEPADLQGGFRLACQSVPRSAELEIDFDG